MCLQTTLCINRAWRTRTNKHTHAQLNAIVFLIMIQLMYVFVTTVIGLHCNILSSRVTLQLKETCWYIVRYLSPHRVTSIMNKSDSLFRCFNIFLTRSSCPILDVQHYRLAGRLTDWLIDRCLTARQHIMANLCQLLGRESQISWKLYTDMFELTIRIKWT